MTCPFLCNARCAVRVVKVVDISVVAQKQCPFVLAVQKTIEILQLQFIDKVFDSAVGEETVELSQLQLVEPGHCRARARRCATTAARWFRRQKTVKVPQLQYI